MEKDLYQQLMDKLTKVCICKGITRLRIKDAIANGANSLEAVKRATGAGSGSCGGKRCDSKIEGLLKENN